jgi:hypothetical protein
MAQTEIGPVAEPLDPKRGRRAELAKSLGRGRVSRKTGIVVFVVLLLAAVSRSPYILLHGRFVAEEGTMYFAHMKTGSIWFIARPVGYLYVFCNIATWLAAHSPLEQAPLVTAWLSLGVIVALVWAALCLPSELLPNAGSRIAAATLLVVGPLAVPEIWLNSTNAQTYLGILALLFLFVSPTALGRTAFVIIAVLLGLAGLSGLYAAALAPLFLFRAIRERTIRRLVLAAIISSSALLQLAVVQTSRASGNLAQGRLTFRGLGVLTRDVAAWHFATFLFGSSIATRLHAHAYGFFGLLTFAFCAFVVAAILASVLACVRQRQVALLLIAAFVLEESLVLFGTRHDAGGRYAVLPIAVLLLISVHAMTTARFRVATGVAAAFCLVSFIGGCSAFWTGQPSALRCINCPQWDQQVSAWRAGRTDHLVIWPYTKATWTVALPHHPSSRATHGARPSAHPRVRSHEIGDRKPSSALRAPRPDPPVRTRAPSPLRFSGKS